MPASTATATATHVLAIDGVLRPYLRALMAADIAQAGPLALAVAPHESVTLTVQIGRADHCLERKGVYGENTRLTGIREWTGAFAGAGDCITLYALLTPLGVVQLLDSQPLDSVPRLRAPVAALLDARVTRALESAIARAPTLQDRLRALAAWLETRATARRRLDRSALRAGRAAMRLCQQPRVPVQTLADEQHVSRRQLERDFGRWMGTSPRHLAQVAHVQAVSRCAQAHGGSLADIAAAVGFADQAHMTRVVRQLTGQTPQHFVRARQSPLAQGFRQATGGGTVYL